MTLCINTTKITEPLQYVTRSELFASAECKTCTGVDFEPNRPIGLAPIELKACVTK